MIGGMKTKDWMEGTFFIRMTNGDLFFCERIAQTEMLGRQWLRLERIEDHNVRPTSNHSFAFPNGINVACDDISWIAQDPVVT